MTAGDNLRPYLNRIQRRALMIGAGGVVLCLLGAFLNPVSFFRAYLLAYLFWLGIALGCLALLMVQHLVRGAWGAVIQRILEAGSRTLPLMALLFIPLLFGLQALYIWVRPEAVAGDDILQHKSAYLNVPFFVLRLVVYVVVWSGLAYLMSRWSFRHDHIDDWASGRPLRRRLQLWSGPGLVVYGLTATFASIDWMMSLEPHWFSTIYGFVFVVGQVLTALAFAVVALALLADFEPFAGVVTSSHFHDLGSLLFTFVMLWAYIAFSQFLIIWSGNLSEEIPWYVHRIQGGWQWVGLALLVFHFAVPFFLLLSRFTKRHASLLAPLAGVLIVMQWVDLWWLVMPAFYPSQLHVHWLDGVAPLGMGGIWIAVFIWYLRGRALLPQHDPRLQREVEHG
jgi:hypothetical protein